MRVTDRRAVHKRGNVFAYRLGELPTSDLNAAILQGDVVSFVFIAGPLERVGGEVSMMTRMRLRPDKNPHRDDQVYAAVDASCNRRLVVPIQSDAILEDIAYEHPPNAAAHKDVLVSSFLVMCVLNGLLDANTGE